MPPELETPPIAPTVAQNWLQCPTLGYFNENWEPTGAWTPNRLLGIAIGDGLDKLFEGQDLPLAEAVTIDRLNAGFEENDDWPLESLHVLALKGLRVASKSTVKDILAQEKVLATQLEVGGARIDLVTQRGVLVEGSTPPSLVITDHKVALVMRADWIQKNLLQCEADHQLWDYAWRAAAYYGRPVTHLRWHQIILSPQAKSVLHEYALDPTIHAAWVRGMESEWAYIHTLKQLPLADLPMRLTQCNGRYGRCRFWDACHVSGRDPKAMKALYTEKVKV